MNVEHAGQHFELGDVEAGRGSDGGQDGLKLSGGAMDVNAGLFHGADHGVNLLFSCFFLHCDNHFAFPVSGVCGPAAWPGALSAKAAWAFLWEASSLRCNARITSMMRS